jgi:uncharacterized protein YlxW (UPF0749 family)
MADADRALGGYDPDAGRNAHEAGRPQFLPVPSLLRELLSVHLDPGYAAAAAQRDRARPADGGRSLASGWAWQALSALLVAVVFATAVAQARTVAPGMTAAQHVLASSARATEASVNQLTAQRDELAAQADTVQRRTLADDAQGRRLLAGLDKLSLAAATTGVRGPGLTVTVTEPSIGANLTDVSKQRVAGSQQIILDRDLQLVINSLWHSGAEAISIGGVRVGPNVTIRQAGGAILVDNVPLASPYAVLAVGPPHTMQDVFGASPGLQRLRLLELSYGVGVTVSVDEGLSLPAGALRSVRFARRIGP